MISIGELQERLLAALEKVKKQQAAATKEGEQQTESAPLSPNHAPALLSQNTEVSLLASTPLTNQSSLTPVKESPGLITDGTR